MEQTQYFNLKDRVLIWNKSPGFNKFKFTKGNKRSYNTSLITLVAFTCRVIEVWMAKNIGWYDLGTIRHVTCKSRFCQNIARNCSSVSCIHGNEKQRSVIRSHLGQRIRSQGKNSLTFPYTLFYIVQPKKTFIGHA